MLIRGRYALVCYDEQLKQQFANSTRLDDGKANMSHRRRLMVPFVQTLDTDEISGIQSTKFGLPCLADVLVDLFGRHAGLSFI